MLLLVLAIMAATFVDKIWALASCLASIATSVGYYLPYWLQGSFISERDEVLPVNFGVFRRCSYPRVDEDGNVKVVDGCGRYTSFTDIPSVFWQISTIVTGTGACLSLLLSVAALATLCLRDSVTAVLARAAGVLQLSAGMLVISGVIIYPNGWGTAPVLQACGYQAGIYQLGNCSLNWAFYLTAIGGAVTVFCSALTCYAFRMKSYRTSYDV